MDATASPSKAPQYETHTCAICKAPKSADGKPLRRCGKCKVQEYCSRKCQTQHWDEHREDCKKRAKYFASLKSAGFTGLRDDVILVSTGHLIIPMRMPLSDTGIGFQYMPMPTVPAQHLQYPRWADVSVARALGFPLRMIGTRHGDPSIPNEPADALGLDPDPDCPYFGHSHWTPRPTGGALLVREDLKPLHSSHVNALHRYGVDVLKEVREVTDREAKGDVVDRHEMAARLLTPQAFKKFFDEMKAVEKVHEPKAWEGVVYPASKKGELVCPQKKPPCAMT